MAEPLVYRQLQLQRPITAEQVQTLFSRLMAPDVPRPIVFETRADDNGVTYWLGCCQDAAVYLGRLVAATTPVTATRAGQALVRPVSGQPAEGPGPGPDKAAVGRVTATPTGLPLGAVDPEQVVTALFGALSSRRPDESVAWQLVLGRARRPHRLPAPRDPFQPLLSRALEGLKPAPSDVQHHLQAHAGLPRLDTTIRLAVTAASPKRAVAIMWQMFGAISLLESPGVHFTLMRDSQATWHRATCPRTGLALTATELVPLIAWPLGERDYPGVPGLHPRLLRPAEIVSRTESVFATSAANPSGTPRPVGIDPQSRLQHMVLLGPTGSGKSTVMEHLILSDIAAGRACVVVDPKRQLIDSLLDRIPEEHADRVVVLDAADTEQVVGFNPLDVGNRDPDVVVDGILATFAAVFADGWGPRTEYLLQATLLTLARAGQARGLPYTLVDLPKLLTDAAFRRQTTASTAIQADTTLAAFWAEFEAMRPRERAAQLAAPLNKLRKLVLRRHLAAVLGQATPAFRVWDIFRKRQVLLVPLNEALVGSGAAQLLGSLLVAELWLATLERASEHHPESRPGFVFIDEVQQYLHLPTSIEAALATSRSYGVGWHLAHQYRAQLPPNLRAGLDTNARSKLCFALGPDDARDMARMAPSLTADDFQALPRFHAYAHLIAGGTPTGWCSVATLPPAPVTGAADYIRRTSRERYGAMPPIEPTATKAPTTAPVDTAATSNASSATAEEGAPGLPTYQKRRQP